LKFDLLNYILSLLGVPFKVFISGTLIGIIPWALLFNIFGKGIFERNMGIVISAGSVIFFIIIISAIIPKRWLKWLYLRSESLLKRIKIKV